MNIQKFSLSRAAAKSRRPVEKTLGSWRHKAHRAERRSLRLRLSAAVGELLSGGDWDFNPNHPHQMSEWEIS